MSRFTQLIRRLATPRRRLVPILTISAAAVALVAAACGGGGGYGGSAAAPSATSASGAAAAPTSAGSTPLSGGQPAPTASAGSGTAAASTDLTVVASNISFDKSSLNAPAGEVKLTLNNQDAIAHNLHLYKGNDASGQSIGMTPIQAGPVQNSFSANLAPGTYHYQCDVHPTQMHGTLVVK